MHICCPYVHIRYLVILTLNGSHFGTLTNFKWQPFWYFSLICYPSQLDSHRDFISYILMYLFCTYIHKRNKATVAFLAHLVFYQTSLCNHDLSVVHSFHPASASSGVSIVRHRHRRHLCAALLATGFRIETSYLV